jgi:transposase-like protein
LTKLKLVKKLFQTGFLGSFYFTIGILESKEVPKTREYSEDLKVRAVEACKSEKTQSEVSRTFGISRQLISVWIKAEKKNKTLAKGIRTGRPRKTSRREDLLIGRMSKQDPFKSSPQIARDINENRAEKISIPIVKRRPNDADSFGSRPCKKPMISKKNRIARFKFSKEHISWTTKD